MASGKTKNKILKLREAIVERLTLMGRSDVSKVVGILVTIVFVGAGDGYLLWTNPFRLGQKLVKILDRHRTSSSSGFELGTEKPVSAGLRMMLTLTCPPMHARTADWYLRLHLLR